MAESPSKTEQDWEKTSGSLVVTDALESPPDDGQPMPVDPKVRRKVDWNLIPLIAILYLCSFLSVCVDVYHTCFVTYHSGGIVKGPREYW